MNFDDIIAMLIAKKDEAKAEYEARVAKIDELLELTGYVEPVEEVVAEEPVEAVEEAVVAVEPVAEPAAEPVAAAAFFGASL